ncbi:MAG: carbon-nitrogen family hydrolase [Thermoanaerobaculia bacterium]
MKVALLQLDIVWEDVERSHTRAARLLEEAARGLARLAVLPEMFSTGFSMRPERVAQPPGGPSERFLRERARALGLWIIGSVPEVRDGLARNVALIVSPSGDVERYAKIHPFSLAGEDRRYAAGDGIVTVSLEGARVTPFICYDLRFPEPFRLAAPDTDLFVVVSNWPQPRQAHLRALLQARAIENLACVVGVNRTGEGDGVRYAGGSVAFSPWGEVLAEAGEEETALFCEVDPAAVAGARETFPALRDRRPEAYRRLR